VLLHIEALDGVPDKGVIHDRGTTISKRISSNILLGAIGGDALIVLHDVAEFLAGEVATPGLLVVKEEAMMLARVAKAEWAPS
jgi:hypothetical protein